MSGFFNSEFAEAKSDVKLLGDYSETLGKDIRKDTNLLEKKGAILGSVSKSWFISELNQRLVQICIFASILFWFLGSYNLIQMVQNNLNKIGLKFGHESTRLVHAVIFGVLLFVFTKLIMDPIVKRFRGVVEGQTNPPSPPALPTGCDNNDIHTVACRMCYDCDGPSPPPQDYCDSCRQSDSRTFCANKGCPLPGSN